MHATHNAPADDAAPRGRDDRDGEAGIDGADATEVRGHKAKRERRRSIAQAVARGRTVGEVAQIFDVSIQTVRDACRAHGVDWNRPALPTDGTYAGPRGDALTNELAEPTSADAGAGDDIDARP